MLHGPNVLYFSIAFVISFLVKGAWHQFSETVLLIIIHLQFHRPHVAMLDACL